MNGFGNYPFLDESWDECPYFCEVCFDQFWSKLALDAHWREHTEDEIKGAKE